MICKRRTGFRYIFQHEIEAEIKTNRITCTGIIIDISLKGMKLQLDHKLQRLDEISVSFKLNNDLIHFNGTIVWEVSSPKSPTICGIFSGDNLTQENMILEELKKYHHLHFLRLEKTF